MTITYTLTPTQLDCEPEIDGKTDVVVKVHWAYNGTDGSKSAGLGGITELTYDPSQHNFTPYSELTRDQVVEWVLSLWSPEKLASNQGIIARQLEVVTPSLPWSVVEPVEEPAVTPPDPLDIPAEEPNAPPDPEFMDTPA